MQIELRIWRNFFSLITLARCLNFRDKMPFSVHIFATDTPLYNQMIEIIQGACGQAAAMLTLVCVHEKLLSVQFTTYNRILYENRFIFSTTPNPIDSSLPVRLKYVIKTLK